MNINSALDIFGFFSMAQTEEKSQSNPLKGDEKVLYEKIVKDLLRFYSERVEHPNPSLTSDSSQQCALIFRQSKSWRDVEVMFNNISCTDTKIKKWVAHWLKRISGMRQLQTTIHTKAQQIQKCADKLQNLPSNERGLIHSLRIEMTSHKKAVAAARKLIVEHLNQGKQELDSLDSKISKNPNCQSIVNFLTKNWLHLRVFSDWPEVSLDEEKLAVQVQRFKGTLPEEDIPFDSLVNSSTKAIFLIKQSDQEETPLEYENVEPGKIIRTTKIELKDKHFAPETPSPRKRSSSMAKISDAYIFNTDFAQAKDEDIQNKVKDTSATARKLERVVKHSLKAVNNKLAANIELIADEASPDSSESSNPIWLIIRFPIQLFGGGATKEPSPTKDTDKKMSEKLVASQF